jgi:Zn-dependent metalloprotease
MSGVRESAAFWTVMIASSLCLDMAALAAASREAPKTGHDSPIVSQLPGRPDPDLLPLWAAFLGNTSGPVSVTWSDLWGTPKAVYGSLSGPLAVSDASARDFLSAQSALLKLDPSLTGITLAGSRETPMGRSYEFTQAADGVPVYGGVLTIHFNRDGRVVGLTNSSVPSALLSPGAPSVKAEQGVESARRAVPARPNEEGAVADEPAATTKLVIYAETGTPTLAWEVILPTSGPTWQLFVHARKGAVLAPAKDLNRYVSGTGQVFLVNAVVATKNNTLRDNNDAASAVPSSAYRTVTLLDLAGNGFLDGKYASSKETKVRASSASQRFVFDRSEDGFSETMGYYFLDYAQRYIQSLGFTTVNNRQQVFGIDRYKKDNSFYKSSSKSITYGTGGVDDAEDAEVIWHEYGHSIQDNQVPGYGRSIEAGSMGEGFGDYWAGTLGAQLSGGFQDLCLADWDAVSYSNDNPPCLRRLDSAKHYPEDLTGNEHDDGELWSAALWQIRAAISAAKADAAILQHHFLLTTDASFNQAANALVTAAINLGYSQQTLNTIRTILRNRGFTVTM